MITIEHQIVQATLPNQFESIALGWSVLSTVVNSQD
jgi:hypothetical protein